MRWLGFVLTLWIACAGCTQSEPVTIAETNSGPEGQPLEPVTLLLNWYPEVEHGGYYAGLVRGYFREAGLDVKILPGGANTPVIQEVATGRMTFGIANADNLLFARAQQAKVVAVMAPLQTSPRCLIVHEKSGIKDFDQLRDMTIAVTPGAAFVEYLRHKVPLQGVRLVPYPGNVEQFLRNEDYAQQGYVFSEPYVAREKGGDPQVLMLSDLGFNPYTSLLFTTQDVIEKRPDLVRRMVGACVRGWTDYIERPEPTNRRIHELNREMDLPALEYGAKAIAPLVLTVDSSARGIGAMTLERWQTLERQLVDTQQLQAGQVAAREAFTTDFWPAPAAAAP